MRDQNHWTVAGALNDLLPRPDNRITIVGETGEYGIPVARMDYSLCDEDKDNMSFFPLWVVVTHFLNIFFMLLLARSGLEVLSAFPKLYWHDDTPPGRQWLRLSKKTFGADSRRPWTTLDEEVSWSPGLCLPGRKNLGLGRHWHFMTVQFWILTGAVYVALVFATGYWRYLIPTSWSIFPDSIRAVGTYLQFHIPGKIPGQPFEPAQKLAYFVVIFVLAPLQIASGAAMSPSVIGRFPWYARKHISPYHLVNGYP